MKRMKRRSSVISDKKKFLFVSLCVELVLWTVRHESDKIFTFSYWGGGGRMLR